MFSWLFDTSMGVPGPAGNWPTWLAVLFHAANLVIALADLAIPLTVAAAWRHRRDGVSARQFWGVAAFLPAMAASRFVRVAEVFGPPYHFTAILDVLTAALTLFCAVRLRSLVKHVLLLPSRQMLHDAVDRLHTAKLRADELLLEATAERDAIRKELDVIRREVQRQAWMIDARGALAAIDRANAAIKTGG